MIPPKSALPISVTSTVPIDGVDAVAHPVRDVLLQKGIAIPYSLVTLRRDHADILVLNLTSSGQVLPRGMCLASITSECIATFKAVPHAGDDLTLSTVSEDSSSDDKYRPIIGTPCGCCGYT